MSISKGKFISFEGIDGCGKSTQVKMLVNAMNKTERNTILVREPGGTIISEEIRQILL
ncbi:MAG: dTMP kinase, partial [Fidelibacterota bacterium]